MGPWRKSLNPTVPALWLLAAQRMKTQSDVPTRENVLFTDCFKAFLVLLNDTQWSVTGKMGERRRWHKQKDPSGCEPAASCS